MFIQALAILMYLTFACLVLFFWPSYKLSIKNIILFVGSGAVGFMLMGIAGGILANETNTIESSALVFVFLCSLALGLFGGSYIGLKCLGTKSI